MDQLVYENHATQFMQHTPQIFFYFPDQLLIAFLGLKWAKKKTCHTQGMKVTHILQPYLEGKLGTPRRCSTHNIILQLALAKEKTPFELELIGNPHPTTIDIYH